MARNFAKLTVRDIGSDSNYQRDLDESRVDAMAKTFDMERLGVPVVSLRKDGSYVVIDGQHRVEALRRAGDADPKLKDIKFLCEVHNGLSLPEEAALFLKLNGGRKAVRVYPKYRARMVAKEPVAVEFTRIAGTLGLRIGPVAGKNTIAAIMAIESVHKRNGNLEDTLSVLKKWGHGESAVFDGELIRDVSRFLFDYSPEVTADELAVKLNRLDPGHVLRRIKGLSDATKNRRLAANSILREIFNHRRGAKKIEPKD